MEFKNLLDYQKADLAYRKIESAIKKDASYIEMKKNREIYEQAKLKNAESETSATNAVNAYNSALAYYEQNAKNIESLCAKLASDDLDEAQESEILEKLEQAKSALAEWEKRVADLKVNADKLLSDYAKTLNDGKVSAEKYKSAKAKFEQLKASKADEIEKAKSDRDALFSSVEPELMAMYEKLTAEGKYPAFVPGMSVDEKQVSCGACGMGLSGVAKSEFEEKGFVVCETCHRIVYKL